MMRCPIVDFLPIFNLDDEWRAYDNANKDDIFFRGRATGDRRSDITAKLQHEGVVQPAHAQCNSRM